MAYGDPVVFVYKGESYEIPHNKTLFALQRITKEDKIKSEPALDVSALENGDIFEMALALHRALTFAGAKIGDPLEVVHAVSSEEGEALGTALGDLFSKLSPPSDLKVSGKKPETPKKGAKAKTKQ